MGVKMTKQCLEINPNSNPNYPNYYSVRVKPKSAANPRHPELGVGRLTHLRRQFGFGCGRRFGWEIYFYVSSGKRQRFEK